MVRASIITMKVPSDMPRGLLTGEHARDGVGGLRERWKAIRVVSGGSCQGVGLGAGDLDMLID